MLVNYFLDGRVGKWDQGGVWNKQNDSPKKINPWVDDDFYH